MHGLQNNKFLFDWFVFVELKKWCYHKTYVAVVSMHCVSASSWSIFWTQENTQLSRLGVRCTLSKCPAQCMLHFKLKNMHIVHAPVRWAMIIQLIWFVTDSEQMSSWPFIIVLTPPDSCCLDNVTKSSQRKHLILHKHMTKTQLSTMTEFGVKKSTAQKHQSWGPSHKFVVIVFGTCHAVR